MCIRDRLRSGRCCSLQVCVTVSKRAKAISPLALRLPYVILRMSTNRRMARSLTLLVGFTPSCSMNVNSFSQCCLLYTSDAADDLLCVDLGGRRIIKKKKKKKTKNNKKIP